MESNENIISNIKNNYYPKIRQKKYKLQKNSIKPEILISQLYKNVPEKDKECIPVKI